MHRYLHIWVSILLLTSCTQTPPPVPVPAPPEDLSTWVVPELVQPPAPAATRPKYVDPPATSAEKVYAYAPGTTYTATVPLGWPLDIVLERGESVLNIVSGPSAPLEQGQEPLWAVKEGRQGEGEAHRAHIFLTATQPAQTLGLIVTTTRRAYLIECKSVTKSATKVIRWTYPDREPEEIRQAQQEPSILPHPWQQVRYHVGYNISYQGRRPDWYPRGAWDDGRKLYILYPETTLFGVVPLVRMVGPNGPQLVNARQVLNVVILDQLTPRLELRVGTGENAEVVEIARGNLRTISCPGDEACPVFPTAAATFGGSQP